ncbi:MAG: ATP-dependent DNA helicase RecG [Patescibacteria group bacterium]
MALNDPLIKIARLRPEQVAGLEKLQLKTVKDLLFYFPFRYEQAGTFCPIKEIALGETVTVFGKIKSAQAKKGWKTKIKMTEAVIEDETGSLQVVWFNQPYLSKKLPPDNWVALSGKIAERQNRKYLANPEILSDKKLEANRESLFNQTDKNKPLLPLYRSTAGLTSGWFAFHIRKLLSQNYLFKEINDPLPEFLRQKYNLPGLQSTLLWVHQPRNSKEAEAARKRLTFEEVLLVQLARKRDRAEYRQVPARALNNVETAFSDFKTRLGFELTTAQKRVLTEIAKDLKKTEPMMRLLEGDVGSGKTAIAASAIWATLKNDLGSALLAPTEILARQHFQSFIEYFKDHHLGLGLITGREAYKFPSKLPGETATKISKNQLLKWLADGQVQAVVGTHALLSDKILFKRLGLLIIDEQHRFGIKQRAKAAGRADTEDKRAHLLSMTATPIPRTLALTVYGDLDLSVLDEMPPGRQAVKTFLSGPDHQARQKAYNLALSELKAGRQVYVICPRIEDPDPEQARALQVKSAKAEYQKLKTKIFPNWPIGLLHSKLKQNKKDETMVDFVSGDLKILVATSMIEVGVNVPQATVIIIEGADRFGLAQLHQLRGRVARSSYQSYCFLFTDSQNENSHTRLQALTKAKSGFDLAEMDLSLRGAGTLIGNKQWGLSDIAMDGLKNLKMVEAARTEATNLLKKDKTLQTWPGLQARLDEVKITHWE